MNDQYEHQNDDFESTFVPHLRNGICIVVPTATTYSLIYCSGLRRKENWEIDVRRG